MRIGNGNFSLDSVEYMHAAHKFSLSIGSYVYVVSAVAAAE